MGSSFRPPSHRRCSLVWYQHCVRRVWSPSCRLYARSLHWFPSLDCRYMPGLCFTRFCPHFKHLTVLGLLRQIGDILQTVASTPSPTSQTISSLLTSPEIILKLVFLSFLSLAPILGRERLRALISNSASSAVSPRSAINPTMEEKQRWAWVQEWRSKIRLASRSRSQEREQSRKELEVFVQEKRALEDLPS